MRGARYIFALFLCTALGLVGGILFRRAQHLQQDDVTVVETAFGGIQKPRRTTRIELPWIAQLERDLATSSGLTRRLHWVEALEKARLEEFPELVHLAQGDAAALRMVAMRWIELNPKHLLSFLPECNDRHVNEILSEVLFQEWSKRDPQSVIRELDVAPSLGSLRGWRTHAAEYITRYHPKLGLPLFERWSIGMFTPSMRGVVKWAAENPREAAEFTMKIRAHYPATSAMKAIGEQWAKIDPAAAMAYADGQGNSLSRALANSVLNTWAENDLPAAAEWLAKADETKRSRFSAPVVEQWAKIDPAAALLWCEENLTGSSLTKAAAGVLRGTAENDLQGAARLVSAMRPSAARSAAAVEVAARILPDPRGTAGPPAEETIAWLNNLDPDATRRVLEEAVRYWPDADAQSMASFLLTTQVKEIPSSVYLLVGRNLGRTDPERALEWANQLPEEARLAGGSDAFARWCQSQPQNAMQWLSNIPTSDVRRSAYLKTALEYLAYEHNVTDRVTAMPLLDRSFALELAKTLDLTPERRERLLSALQP